MEEKLESLRDTLARIVAEQDQARAAAAEKGEASDAA
jgi:hypothetical protein